MPALLAFFVILILFLVIPGQVSLWIIGGMLLIVLAPFILVIILAILLR